MSEPEHHDEATPSADSQPAKAPTFAREKSRLIAAMLGVSLINGLLLAHFGSDLKAGAPPIDLLTALVLFALGFVWLHYDALETGYRRSTLFNVGIVLLAILFVPLYFMQARPAEKRWQPILGFFGLILGSALAGMIGLAMGGGAAVAPL